MSSGRSGGNSDPFEDVFAENYDPTDLSFARVAFEQAWDLIQDARQLATFKLRQPVDGIIARSARERAFSLLGDLDKLRPIVENAYGLAKNAPKGSPEQCMGIDLTIEKLGDVKALTEVLFPVLASMAEQDPQPPPFSPHPLPPLDSLMNARANLKAGLDGFLRRHYARPSGEYALLISTPGVGKTHVMLEAAYQAQQQRKRVIFAVRTKAMLEGDHPEIVNRAHSVSPLGRVTLNVITGRSEKNCKNYQAVQAAAEHGLRPAFAVCLSCDHYPTNATIMGLPICDYFAERIRAHNLSQSARRGASREYPLILTTHSSMVQAFGTSQGGRWGSFWKADLAFVDEDPTSALEEEIILSEAQTKFESKSPDLRVATMGAALFRKAIEIAKRDRSAVELTGFKAPGSTQLGSHEIHSDNGTAYRAQALHGLLRRALAEVQQTHATGPLPSLLRDVDRSGAFTVPAGALVTVTSTAQINAMDVPPVSLKDIAYGVFEELHHEDILRHILYERTHGTLPPMMETGDQKSAFLQQTTTAPPLSYQVRLECIPAQPGTGEGDRWRYVLRRPVDFAWSEKTGLVAGDAYALPEHYHRLLGKPPVVIDVMAELHPDVEIVRILDDHCGIGVLKRNGIERILAMVESVLIDRARPGDRVLIYTHKALKPKVETRLRGWAHRFDLGDWATMTWWSGRGEDRFSGWEWTFLVSDPIQNVTGIEHVANARAFANRVRASTPEERIMYAEQLRVGKVRHRLSQALQNSPPGIQLEHLRMNVAEHTQAGHRGRPVHHGIHLYSFGGMEMSREMVAQTVTVLPGGHSKQNESGAQRRDVVEGSVDRFVSVEETIAAVRSIIDWFGVFSPWFCHAFLMLHGETASLPAQTDNYQFKESGRKSEIVIHPGAATPTVPGPPVPGFSALAQPVLRRVWDPPVDWWHRKDRDSLPKAVRQALSQLSSLLPSFVQPSPSWMSGRSGRRPRAFYDRDLCSEAEARKYLAEILDNQYGIVVTEEVGGEMVTHLRRPNYRETMLPCLKTWKTRPAF